MGREVTDTPEPCGCRTTGYVESLIRIIYCPTHAAAPMYEAALEAIAEHRHNTEEAQRLVGYRNPGTVLRDEAFFARAAITKAKGNT